MYDVLICYCFVDHAVADEVDGAVHKTSVSLRDDVYRCPAWTSFRLDINAVLNAMFPASASTR